MSKERALLYCSCAAGLALFIALFLHITVLYLLSKVKRGATNQKLLITNVSLTELLFIPFGILYYSRLLWTSPGTLPYDLTTVGFAAFAVNCYFANAFMIFDRTYAGFKPLRYRTLFTTGRVKAVAIVLWVLFLFTPIPYVTNGFETFVVSMIILTLFLDATMIGVGVFCYVVVLMHSNRRGQTFKQGDGNRGVQRAAARQRSQVFKVAVPVLMTFLLFVTLPDIISLVLSMKKIDPVMNRKFLYTISSLNVLCDPLLFLYQYPPLKTQFLKQFCCARNIFQENRSQNSTKNRASRDISSSVVKTEAFTTQSSSSFDTRF